MALVIVLGYPGSGKTTLIQQASVELNVPWFSYGCSVRDGETRSLITCLNEFIQIHSTDPPKYILVDGPRTPTDMKNLKTIPNPKKFIYLDIPPEIAFDRMVARDKSTMIRNTTNHRKRIIDAQRDLYICKKMYPCITINAHQSPKDVVDALCSALQDATALQDNIDDYGEIEREWLKDMLGVSHFGLRTPGFNVEGDACEFVSQNHNFIKQTIQLNDNRYWVCVEEDLDEFICINPMDNNLSYAEINDDMMNSIHDMISNLNLYSSIFEICISSDNSWYLFDVLVIRGKRQWHKGFIARKEKIFNLVGYESCDYQTNLDSSLNSTSNYETIWWIPPNQSYVFGVDAMTFASNSSRCIKAIYWDPDMGYVSGDWVNYSKVLPTREMRIGYFNETIDESNQMPITQTDIIFSTKETYTENSLITTEITPYCTSLSPSDYEEHQEHDLLHYYNKRNTTGPNSICIHGDKLIGMSFSKFFPIMDSQNTEIDENPPIDIEEPMFVSPKYDGTLILVYRYGDTVYTQTKRRPNSEQSIWAKEYLRNCNIDFLEENHTYHFEACYQNNLHTTEHHYDTLILLTIVRHPPPGKTTSTELSYDELVDFASNFGVPVIPRFISTCEILKGLCKLKPLRGRCLIEGWVAIVNGHRKKIIGDNFLKSKWAIKRLHKKYISTYKQLSNISILRDNLPLHHMITLNQMINNWELPQYFITTFLKGEKTQEKQHDDMIDALGDIPGNIDLWKNIMMYMGDYQKLNVFPWGGHFIDIFNGMPLEYKVSTVVRRLTYDSDDD